MLSYLRVRYQLYRLQKRSQPDRAFVLSLERRLFGMGEMRSVWKMAWAMTMVLGLFLSGSTYLLETSEQVAPGHRFYPWRLAFEELALDLSWDGEVKKYLQRQNLTRRAEEGLMALAQGRKFDPLYAQQVVEFVHTDSSSEEAAIMADGLDELLVEQGAVFEHGEETFIDKMAYDQTLSLVNEVVKDSDPVLLESTKDLEENLL